MQGASGTVYRAVYDPSLALAGRADADDDLGLSVVRSTCAVAVKKMKVPLTSRGSYASVSAAPQISPSTNMKTLVNEIRLMRESRSVAACAGAAALLMRHRREHVNIVQYIDSYLHGEHL